MWLKRVLRWLQPVMIVAALAFVVWLLAAQWQELATYQWHLSPGWLLLSAMCMIGAWTLEIQIWRWLLVILGARLPWIPSMRIWFLSAITRYIPGNICQPLSMTLQAQRHGVRVETTLTSFLLYQGVLLLAAFPLAAGYFLLTGNWGLLTPWVGSAGVWLVAGVLVPVALFLLVPGLLVRLLNWALVKVGRPTVDADLSRGRLVILLVACMLNWILWGATFATLTFGVTEFTPQTMQTLGVHLVLTYPIAYTIGFLSLITPSGLGVREGALFVLLAPFLSSSMITVASLAMRGWSIAGELIMALISVALPDRTVVVSEDSAAVALPPLAASQEADR